MSKFHNLDYDKRGAYLVSLAETAGFPIIAVREETNLDHYSEDYTLDSYYSDDYVSDFSGTYEFDTAKIIIPEDGYMTELNYVGHIIEAALLGKTDFYSSQKYSFGDTPDWWKDFHPTDTADRKIIEISVYINH